MDYTRAVVALALAVAALTLGATAAPEEDVPLEDVGTEDAQGRFLGLLKKPLFFNGYDSVVETSLDNVGYLLGKPFASFLAGATRFRPDRPQPARPFRPFLPSRPYLPYSYFDSPFSYYDYPSNGYATQYGYFPYAPYDPYDNTYREQKEYDVEVVDE